jgi:hypothetical protein
LSYDLTTLRKVETQDRRRNEFGESPQISWKSSCSNPYLPPPPVLAWQSKSKLRNPSTYSIIHVSHDNLPQFHMSDPPDSSLATLHSYPPKQSSPPFPPSAVNTELRFSAIRYHHCPRTSRKSHAADRGALPLLLVWTFSSTHNLQVVRSFDNWQAEPDLHST